MREFWRCVIGACYYSLNPIIRDRISSVVFYCFTAILDRNTERMCGHVETARRLTYSRTAPQRDPQVPNENWKLSRFEFSMPRRGVILSEGRTFLMTMDPEDRQIR